MAQEIVLFHSALGLRPSVLSFADELRQDGHVVHTPHLFGGMVFDDLGSGAGHRDEIGIPTLIGRAQAAVAALPEALVYAGFSMGAGPAELLAATRPGARGAVLMHGAFDPAAYGLDGWPGVPLQVHHAVNDDEVDSAEIEALASVARQSGAEVEVFAYDRGGHLFEDPAYPDHDADSARLMLDRVLHFLRQLPSTQR